MQVYRWTSPAEAATVLRCGSFGDPPSTRPAIRVWGDAILSEFASQRSWVPALPDDLWGSALHAWFTSAALAQRPEGSIQLALTVDAESCWYGSFSLRDELLDFLGRGDFFFSLIDAGVAADEIEEAFPFVSVPLISTNRQSQERLLADLPASLYKALMNACSRLVSEYFSHFGSLYSQGPEGLSDVLLEVLVPRSAVKSVAAGTSV